MPKCTHCTAFCKHFQVQIINKYLKLLYLKIRIQNMILFQKINIGVHLKFNLKNSKIVK